MIPCQVIVNLTQTDYRRFIALLNRKDFLSSSYVDVWRFALLLLASNGVSEKFPSVVARFPKFQALKGADKNVFSRESFFARQRDFSEYLLG